MKDTVNGPLMRTHAITGKTRLVAIAAVAGVLLLMPRLTAAAPWFLPDSDDKILAEAASLIEQGRLQDSLRLLDLDGGVDRLPATGSARVDWHYLRAYVLRFTRDRVKALQETDLALRPTEFQSASVGQARVTLLRSWLYADGGDWSEAGRRSFDPVAQAGWHWSTSARSTTSSSPAVSSSRSPKGA